jgi:ABC-type multidrug transport system ATPase subunit
MANGRYDGRTTVRACDLGVRFGAVQVLHPMSFECREGEWVLLAGPTGAGKSTLLRALNGLCRPTEGRAFVFGSWIPGRTRREAASVWKQTGTVLQEIALFETRSARGNVELALRAAGFNRAAARSKAVEWLERLNLGDKTDRYPWRLSGGERQRVALARALAPSPRLLFMDEPTSALDRATARIVLDAVRELADQGSTVLMSSHREDEVLAMCDRRIELRHGRLVAETAARRDLAEHVRAVGAQRG